MRFVSALSLVIVLAAVLALAQSAGNTHTYVAAVALPPDQHCYVRYYTISVRTKADMEAAQAQNTVQEALKTECIRNLTR